MFLKEEKNFMDKLSVKEYQNPFEDKEMKKEKKKERRR